jgi:hypothetical protein
MSRNRSEPVFPQLPPPVAGTVGVMGQRIGDAHSTIAAIVACRARYTCGSGAAQPAGNGAVPGTGFRSSS